MTQRKSKFRGKCGKYWAYGDLVHGDESTKETTYILGYGIYGSRQEVNSKTVGEFIGKKTPQGKEIYEGDIVEFESEVAGQKRKLKFKVEWDNELTGWIPFNIDEGGNDIEYCFGWKAKDCNVIGNIYDNPELTGVQDSSVEGVKP